MANEGRNEAGNMATKDTNEAGDVTDEARQSSKCSVLVNCFIVLLIMSHTTVRK